MASEGPASEWVAFDTAMTVFARTRPILPLAVAFSGGADSTALLLACVERWPGQVVAWHVHHDLQDAADGFEACCRTVCARLNIPLEVRHVDARPAAGQSPEAAARALRYAAFDGLATGGAGRPAVGTVLLAQHADDQVETILLALSRGAGLPGLAAMPRRWQRQRVAYCRPLLDVPVAAIHAWLRARGEIWVEDPTNTDTDFTRNRIRHGVLPALREAFPHFRRTFARSAAHAAQAQEILAEIAAQDLQACGNPPQLATLRALSEARRANVLRHWLRTAHGQTPSTAQLAALQTQVVACVTQSHRIDLKVGLGRVHRLGEGLIWQPHSTHTAGNR